MLRPTRLWKYNTSTGIYTDLSSNIKSDSSFSFISSATDVFFFSSNRRFVGMDVTLSTNGSYTGLTASIWDGENWVQVEEVNDYNFDSTSHYIWNLPNEWTMFTFSDTEPYAATVPDSIELYWMKIVASAVTTTAVISRLRLLPFCMYCSIEDVGKKLGLKSEDAFTHTSVPLTSDDVEDIINNVQGDIDWQLQQSWRLNYQEDQEFEFAITGIKLIQRDIIRINSVKLWNGSSWETQTEGRTYDYFYVAAHGMLYWSRYFMLPARMALQGNLWGGFGVGEFTYPVRVCYTYGKDWEKDKKFPKIKELTAKMSALRVLDATNYLALIPGGSRGGEELSGKVERWTREVQASIDEMKPALFF